MELFISGTANWYSHCHSCSLLVVLNEKPPQALWRREVHQSYKQNNATRYLLPNFQATALWGLLCILLVACLFGTLPALFSWGEKRARSYTKKWVGPHQQGHFHQGALETSFLGRRYNPYIPFLDYSLLDSCV